MSLSTVNDLLQTAAQTVGQCERCGACLAVCPLYQIRDIERVSPRGKNMLSRALAQGGLDPSRELLDAVGFCLLCAACAENCPSKIETGRAILDVRQYLIGRAGGPELKYQLLGAVMKRPRLVKALAGLLAAARRLGIGGLAAREYTGAQLAAAFAGPRIHEGPARMARAAISPADKTAYFYGCGMRTLFPAAAAATQRLLDSAAPLFPRDNVCCGLPHLAHGLRRDFLELTKENIALYEDVQIVVTDCASCGGTLKRAAAYLAGDRQWRERAAAFSRKVMDLSEYLTRIGYAPRRRTDAVFTYHDPCHLVRGQGISAEPRRLLRAAGNFVELKDADVCCGGAGSFHIDYPAAAARILQNKRENIEHTGADIVVTACPVCLTQLRQAAQDGGRFKAMHISQVL